MPLCNVMNLHLPIIHALVYCTHQTVAHKMVIVLSLDNAKYMDRNEMRVAFIPFPSIFRFIVIL